MNKLMIITVFFISILDASVIPSTIDELLEGKEVKAIDVPYYDPFKRAKPLLKKKYTKRYVAKPRAIELIAVMNDKAFINGRWYKENDKLSLGKIYKITLERVYIKQGTRTTVLKLQKGKNLLKINEKEE